MIYKFFTNIRTTRVPLCTQPNWVSIHNALYVCVHVCVQTNNYRTVFKYSVANNKTAQAPSEYSGVCHRFVCTLHCMHVTIYAHMMGVCVFVCVSVCEWRQGPKVPTFKRCRQQKQNKKTTYRPLGTVLRIVCATIAES